MCLRSDDDSGGIVARCLVTGIDLFQVGTTIDRRGYLIPIELQLGAGDAGFICPDYA